MSEENSEDVLVHATDAVEQSEQQQYISKLYKITNPQHIEFIIMYIKTRNPVTAYRHVYGKKMSVAVAASGASRLLRTVKVGVKDILDFVGHNEMSIAESLTKLKHQSPDKYLTHMEKLLQLDVQKVEHSGGYTIKYESEFMDD